MAYVSRVPSPQQSGGLRRLHGGTVPDAHRLPLDVLADKPLDDDSQATSIKVDRGFLESQPVLEVLPPLRIESEIECRTLLYFGFGPDATVMTMNDPLDGGKADAGAIEFFCRV